MSSVSLSRIITTFPEYANNQKYVYGWTNNLIVIELLPTSKQIQTCGKIRDLYHAIFRTNTVNVVAIINIKTCTLEQNADAVFFADQDEDDGERIGCNCDLDYSYDSGNVLQIFDDYAVIKYCRSFETAFINCLDYTGIGDYTGSYTERWDDGSLKCVCGYVNGNLNGTMIEWDKDNCDVVEITHYKNGEIVDNADDIYDNDNNQ